MIEGVISVIMKN